MGDMLRIMLTLIIIFPYSDRCFYCWFIIMDTSDCHSKTNTHLYIKASFIVILINNDCDYTYTHVLQC